MSHDISRRHLFSTIASLPFVARWFPAWVERERNMLLMAIQEGWERLHRPLKEMPVADRIKYLDSHSPLRIVTMDQYLCEQFHKGFRKS